MATTALLFPLVRVRAGRLDDRRLAALAARATSAPSRSSTTAITGAARVLPAHARLAGRGRGRGAADVRARPPRTGPGPPTSGARGCTRSPATGAGRCSRPAGPAVPSRTSSRHRRPQRGRPAARRAARPGRGIGRLPDDQRDALVLAEVGDFSPVGDRRRDRLPTTKVKALVIRPGRGSSPSAKPARSRARTSASSSPPPAAATSGGPRCAGTSQVRAVQRLPGCRGRAALQARARPAGAPERRAEGHHPRRPGRRWRRRRGDRGRRWRGRRRRPLGRRHDGRLVADPRRQARDRRRAGRQCRWRRGRRRADRHITASAPSRRRPRARGDACRGWPPPPRPTGRTARPRLPCSRAPAPTGERDRPRAPKGGCRAAATSAPRSAVPSSASANGPASSRRWTARRTRMRAPWTASSARRTSRRQAGAHRRAPGAMPSSPSATTSAPRRPDAAQGPRQPLPDHCPALPGRRRGQASEGGAHPGAGARARRDARPGQERRGQRPRRRGDRPLTREPRRGPRVILIDPPSSGRGREPAPGGTTEARVCGSGRGQRPVPAGSTPAPPAGMTR